MDIKINVMDIEATKLELMHLLLQTQKEGLLAKVKKVFEEEGTDWWDDMDEEEKRKPRQVSPKPTKGSSHRTTK